MSNCRFMASNGPQTSMQVSGPAAEDDQRCIGATEAYFAPELLAALHKAQWAIESVNSVLDSDRHSADKTQLAQAHMAIIKAVAKAKGE